MQITSKQICKDLLAFMGHFKTCMAKLADVHNLTPAQLHTLYIIKQGSDTTGHIAGNLHCDASNITGIVDRLVSQGLVTRQESPSDRRTKTLTLTTKGQAVIQETQDNLPAALGCSKLAPAERNDLHRIISKCES